MKLLNRFACGEQYRVHKETPIFASHNNLSVKWKTQQRSTLAEIRSVCTLCHKVLMKLSKMEKKKYFHIGPSTACSANWHNVSFFGHLDSIKRKRMSNNNWRHLPSHQIVIMKLTHKVSIKIPSRAINCSQSLSEASLHAKPRQCFRQNSLNKLWKTFSDDVEYF